MVKVLLVDHQKVVLVILDHPLATYATGTLGAFITPSFNGDEDYIANFNGKTWTMTWSGVDFEETGTYDIQAEADDKFCCKG